jgi:hypothetical protein
MKTTIATPLLQKRSSLSFAFMLALSFLFVLSASSSLYAQEDQNDRGQINSNEKKEKQKEESDIKTIFGNNQIVHGGYGAASAVFTEFDGKSALLVGARGGWIINHSISLGLGGYGITNNIYFRDIVENQRVSLSGGYGGMYIEFIVFPKQPIHVCFPILIGAGGVAYSIEREFPQLDKNGDPIDLDPEEERNFFLVDDDAYFVIEPGMEIEMNVLRNFRIALGASYRYFGDLDIQSTESDAFDGLAAGITFKFGKF